MRIVCPHCKAAYRVDAIPEGAVLICHRCKGRFQADQAGNTEKTPPAAPPEEQLPLFDGKKKAAAAPSAARAASTSEEETKAEQPERAPFQPAESAGAQESPPPFLARTADDKPGKPPKREGPRIGKARIPVDNAAAPAARAPVRAVDEAEGEAAEAETADFTLPPPLRRGPRIWPWLAAMLIAIAGAGFYVQKDQWLANPALRGMLANLHLPLPPRDDDWQVEPASVLAQWIRRDDGSRVLVIEGKVKNRLDADLPPPAIEIVFFDPDAPDQVLERRVLPITAPPSLEAIRHAPWSPPPVDDIPVPARGERAFVLVLERLPERTGDFTLLPRAQAPSHS